MRNYEHIENLELMIRLFFAFLIFCCFISCVQKHEGIFTFSEVGWTIKLPDGFRSLDSSIIASENARSKEKIQSLTGKKLNHLGKKTMFAARNNNDLFSFSLTPFHENSDGSWINVNQKEKDILYETLTKDRPTAQLDTSNTTEIIGSLRFDKFKITGKENGRILFNFTMLSKLYKNYIFNINYLYLDPNVGSEIETMLRQSKFGN